MAQTLLPITVHQGSGGLLDRLSWEALPPDPSIEELCALAGQAVAHGPLWLGGGEPTLRADLPELIEALSAAGVQPGLISDGRVLSQPGAAQALQAAGLKRVRLRVHSARADAHDWLTGRPGALKEVLRAARRCLQADLELELQACLVRPTLPHLSEWVQLASRMGADAAHLVRWVIRPEATQEAISLTPRMGLLEDPLEAAAATAVAFQLPLRLWGFPHCVAPRLRSLQGRQDLLLPAEQGFARLQVPRDGSARCGRCPGAPGCDGPPVDYLERFGRDEFLSEQGESAHDGVEPAAPTQRSYPVPEPPARAYRAAATRVRFSRDSAGRADLAGDPIPVPAHAAAKTPECLRTSWGGPGRAACPSCGDATASGRSPRDNRRRLVWASQQGAARLRVAGADVFSHAGAPGLLADTPQLSFDCVELAGEAGPLDEWQDDALRRLRGVASVHGALYGPDAGLHDQHMDCTGAFDATLRGLERAQQIARVQVGCYAVLHDHHQVPAYASAWDEGRLPGAPCFRLSPQGGSLKALARVASELEPGPVREALARVVPACLLPRPDDATAAESAGLGMAPDPASHEAPSGSDRLGEFDPCSCDAAAAGRCPGRARGWEMDS